MYKIVTDIWYLNHGKVDVRQHFEEVFDTKEDAKNQLWCHNDYETNNASTIAIEEENCFIAVHLRYGAKKLEDYISYITSCRIEECNRCRITIGEIKKEIDKLNDKGKWTE